MKTKDEAKNFIKIFIEWMKNQIGRYPKVFRTDNGLEYVNKIVETYLADRGITHEKTCPYTSQQNGVSERKNLTLCDAARTLLNSTKLSLSFWGEAIMCANFTLNRVTCSTGKIPYEEFFNKKSTAELHVFGSIAYTHIPPQKQISKLHPRGSKGIFVGYSPTTKGYRVFDLKSKKVIISRHIHFTDIIPKAIERKDEKKSASTFAYLESSDDESDKNKSQQHAKEIPQEIPEVENVEIDVANQPENLYQEEQNQDPPEREQEHQLRRSTRVSKQPERLCYLVEEIYEPKNIEDALNGPNKEAWTAAIYKELEAIKSNNTYTLMKLPENKKAINSMFVFKVKPNSDGISHEFKARLVAKGCSQRPGIDYTDVHAPVSRDVSLRILLSMAAKEKLKVIHIDISSAFLNGNLKEEIYLRQPKYFEDKDNKLVWRLHKSLYGLKQAAHAWNESFNEKLKEIGFHRSKVDSCLFFKKAQNQGGETRAIYLLLYVDDACLVSKDIKLINDTIKHLNKKFKVKNLGPIKLFLGMKIEKDVDGNFHINQKQLIDKIIRNANLEDAKPSKYPIDIGFYKLEDNEMLPNNFLYQELIGSLIYIATHSRPDISASVSILSQKIKAPSIKDLKEVKRVIRYLKFTSNQTLMTSNLKSSKKGIQAFSDSNFAEDRNDFKSNSGFIILLNGGPIAWRCRKQSLVTQSTAEAEFYALAETLRELQWINSILPDLDIPKEIITIHVDNQSTIKMIEGTRFKDRSKHIAVKISYVKEMINNNFAKVEYVSTEENVGDLLTKPLSGQRIKYILSILYD